MSFLAFFELVEAEASPDGPGMTVFGGLPRFFAAGLGGTMGASAGPPVCWDVEGASALTVAAGTPGSLFGTVSTGSIGVLRGRPRVLLRGMGCDMEAEWRYRNEKR